MWRWFCGSMALSAGVAVIVVLAAVGYPGPGARGVFAESSTPTPVVTPWAYIDKDITNGQGPCDPDHIDNETREYVGDEHQLAICVAGLLEPVRAFNLRIRYDDTLDECVNKDCTAAPYCLDDNPDANAGQTRWGDGLGDGWICTFPPPTQEPFCDQGVARITCYASLESSTHTLGDSESWGVLAVLTLEVVDVGVDEVSIEYLDVHSSGGFVIGCCRSSDCGSPSMPCQGATDTKVYPGPDHTPPPTSTPPPPPSPTATLLPLPATTPAPPDSMATRPAALPPTGTRLVEDGFLWMLVPSLLVAAAGVAVVGGLYLRFARGQRGGST